MYQNSNHFPKGVDHMPDQASPPAMFALRTYRSEKYLRVLATLASAARAMHTTDIVGVGLKESSPHSRRNAAWQLLQRLARREWVAKEAGGTNSITAAGQAVLSEYRAVVARQQQVVAVAPRMLLLRAARQELRETTPPQPEQSRQEQVKGAISCDLCGEACPRDEAREQLRRHGAVICLRCNRDLTAQTELLLDAV
jgi:uncharacterized paraquat-inducible protein A